MGPLVVEAVREGIEAHSLLQGVDRGRLRGFGFERQMHALVPAVLLGMPRRDPLQRDAEAQPPHGGRQPIVLKRALWTPR